MLYLSELKEKINRINVPGEDFKIVTRNRVGKEGRITFGKDPVTEKRTSNMSKRWWEISFGSGKGNFVYR